MSIQTVRPSPTFPTNCRGVPPIAPVASSSPDGVAAVAELTMGMTWLPTTFRGPPIPIPPYIAITTTHTTVVPPVTLGLGFEFESQSVRQYLLCHVSAFLSQVLGDACAGSVSVSSQSHGGCRSESSLILTASSSQRPLTRVSLICVYCFKLSRKTVYCFKLSRKTVYCVTEDDCILFCH
ncbi:hypothetical protein BaRGS_00030778 [Batillaria attramentaria]|uniref:Uncharacterized protein n=1 Tax=Batillaria attramentaria TaxID=370345 RepID=A0ABD0JSH6_9CAEN